MGIRIDRIIFSVLIAVGLINLFPIVGLRSANALSDLYGIGMLEGDLLLLMRHRALLFGVLGMIILASAFNKKLRTAAILAGLTSMLGFVILTLAAGESGAKLQTVVLIDLGASAALVVAALLGIKKR